MPRVHVLLVGNRGKLLLNQRACSFAQTFNAVECKVCFLHCLLCNLQSLGRLLCKLIAALLGHAVLFHLRKSVFNLLLKDVSSASLGVCNCVLEDHVSNLSTSLLRRHLSLVNLTGNLTSPMHLCNRVTAKLKDTLLLLSAPALNLVNSMTCSREHTTTKSAKEGSLPCVVVRHVHLQTLANSRLFTKLSHTHSVVHTLLVTNVVDKFLNTLRAHVTDSKAKDRRTYASKEAALSSTLSSPLRSSLSSSTSRRFSSSTGSTECLTPHGELRNIRDDVDRVNAVATLSSCTSNVVSQFVQRNRLAVVVPYKCLPRVSAFEGLKRSA